MLRGRDAWQGGMRVRGVCGGGACVSGGVCMAGGHGQGACVVGGGHVWQVRWPLQQTVCILLECIPVA